MSLNVVNLVGRVGIVDFNYIHVRDQLVAVCKLTLAVKRVKRNSDEPDWFNLEIWGKTAKIAGDYVKKGSLIGVQGSLKIDTWDDRNTGAKRSRPVIKVDKLDLLGSKRDSNSSGANPYEDGEI
jgi:single-strand DNA-binding protein